MAYSTAARMAKVMAKCFCFMESTSKMEFADSAGNQKDSGCPLYRTACLYGVYFNHYTIIS